MEQVKGMEQESSKEQQRYCELLSRLCENIFGAISEEELQCYLPITYAGMNAGLSSGQFVVTLNGKYQSALQKRERYYENSDLLQRLVYAFGIRLKSENAVDKYAFRASVLKLIKEIE